MPRQGLNTETVIKTAAILVEENGCENLTLHKLADQLNIKPASLYTHIKGIDELYISLGNLALKQLSDEITYAIEGKKRAEAIRVMSNAYRNYVRQNPEMYKIILKIPHSSSYELIKTGQNVKAVLFEILSQYTSDKADIIYYSRYYHSVLHGFISLEQAGFFSNSSSVDKSLSHIVEDFITRLDAKYGDC